MMMIRVCSRDGLERVTVDNPYLTVSEFKALIENQLRVPVSNQTLSINQNLLLANTLDDMLRFTDMSNPHTLISSLGISHGSMIYLAYEGERTVARPAVKPSGSFGRKMTMDDLIAKQMRVSRQEIADKLRLQFRLDRKEEPLKSSIAGRWSCREMGELQRETGCHG